MKEENQTNKIATTIDNHNPDVLLCLANLSNDEVFTPPDVANAMLDMLPQELFENPNTKFLDPAVKSGVFLREIAKRLNEGLKDKIPNEQDRVDHIMQKQLYGIAITEITSLLSRRTLYCSKSPNYKYSVSKFDTADGNIRFKKIQHTWRNGKCVFCGASESEYARDESRETHAYEFIHKNKPEEIFNMHFDVIIGNPPYQLTTNTGEKVAAKQAKPIFNIFVESALKMNPKYLTMIIPARWYTGGIGLGDFRNDMLNNRKITKIVDYSNSKDCFPGVAIAGGVCYFLYDRDKEDDCEIVNILGNKENITKRKLNEFGNIFIRSNEAITIIDKVKAKATNFMDERVYPLDPFGFHSSARGNKEEAEGDIKLIHSQGVGYVKRSEVIKNSNLIDNWKVIIGKVVPSNGEVGIDPEKGYRGITCPRILKPGEISTFSYMLLNYFDREEEALNFSNYMKCKFPRFLLRLTYSSMNIDKTNFHFVPIMDFSRSWSDEELYHKFELNEDEIKIIEKTIRLFDKETA